MIFGKGYFMKIGVLGATGHVGKGALRVLDKTDHKISAYYHSPQKAEVMKAEFSDKVIFKHIDIYDEELLNGACGECDMIINCTGPSGKIMNRIAVLCMKENKIYIDVSGGKKLKQMMETEFSFGKNGTCVLGAGIYPGLTEILAGYIVQKNPQLQELKLYFYGNSPLSEIAAYDIVAGMEESNGGMSYVRNGKITKLAGVGTNEGNKIAPFDKLITMPVLSDEFYSLVCKKKIPKAYFYHSFQNDKALMDFIMIKAMEQYKTEEQKKASATKIQQLFFCKDRPKEVCIIVEYKIDDSIHYFKLESEEDWSLITGYVAGLTAVFLAGAENIHNGVNYVAEVVEPEEIIRSINKICQIHMDEW